ncbi:single-stranded DNA exonuclease [Brevundimonas sp. EAKA]|jgi:single-stranded-DNA-specific exonuclease|uniref:Single-stranded-DNA-specific exonuclease RecJ n=1 Tax=Brevundimonas mediterranea TaxID=74329 RepID=A0A7Z9C6L8_9CAUL|nr:MULTISPECIES: single-stranded-DNA-specific exonuclease RecJ [Brevundimonas]MBU4195265.1 single-stranded-DNA-specific exonuclease RecJ [Alphaproteobacteria bacterium]OGN45490.1 MAG: single-stranded-DNA-specific exonuclease RecJ [Caulobacterales bacterium RIFCSPHIGHO2_12_FULL_68_13]KDP94272.1 single-stranded DNA exonuclease [Brevundimonas sp. EAKA]MBU4239626.1 single-stranded-DNA-specific exonuclease RecJ [Alphaproteobacteria bacterium]VDC51152.1 Single-stranded-DNA-specific exonuclease RecJ 
MADDGGFKIDNAFLGVTQSLSGRAWRQRPAEAATIRAHMQGLGLEEPLARALASRGVRADQGADFLTPTLRALFPDPSSFMDMDAAAEALLDAFQAKSQVHIFADYDVDGASSAALLVRWFRAMGADLPIYVPDRLTEGYGPSAKAFDTLKAAGADLVVTVDCGAAANEALAHAAAIDLNVVVIDHHLMRSEPPRALAVVNPNRPGCNSGQGNLAAAGVVFVLLAALNREARRRGLFADRPEPDIRQWLDLAALGAICDVTALTGFNRALTGLGLKVMSDWKNPGLRALLAAAGAEQGPAKSNHAGFILGPRINAGGRIGRSDLGARLLSTDDPAEAQALALELDALNLSRREVERAVTEAAVRRVEATGAHADETALVVVAGEDWHPGVVGIVAGRLRERWRKPVIVIGLDPVTGLGKGSGRSQPGMNLGRAIQAAWEAGILLAGGGHAMAAGLTMDGARLAELTDFLNDRLAGERIEAVAMDALEIDALIDPGAATRALFESFEQLAPFGPSNPEPVFALNGVQAREPVQMNGGHVRCRLVGPDGASVRAVAWRCADLPTGQALLSGQGGLNVVGRLKADDWNGRRGVQFEIEDVADPRRV